MYQFQLNVYFMQNDIFSVTDVCSGPQLRCFNGGTCVANTTLARGYSCNCPAQYEGESCQTLKSKYLSTFTHIVGFHSCECAHKN